jgi:hypothetical protein
MFDKQKELSTIDTEHKFMNVGDPMIVNQHDNHSFHIEEHTKQLATLTNDDESVYKQHGIDILKSHIAFHEQYIKRI